MRIPKKIVEEAQCCYEGPVYGCQVNFKLDDTGKVRWVSEMEAVDVSGRVEHVRGLEKQVADAVRELRKKDEIIQHLTREKENLRDIKQENARLRGHVEAYQRQQFMDNLTPEQIVDLLQKQLLPGPAVDIRLYFNR